MTKVTEFDFDQAATTYASWLGDILEEPVSADEEFLDVGGNSMIAITLNGKLKDAFDIELDMRSLFTNTIRDAIKKAVNA